MSAQISETNTEFTSVIGESEAESENEQLSLAMFQEKQDLIDQKNDELEAEREALADAMLTVVNLKEELAIAEKTAQEYKQKMESEAEKAKQFKTAASE